MFVWNRQIVLKQLRRAFQQLIFLFCFFHRWNILWTMIWRTNYLRRNTRVRASKKDVTQLSRNSSESNKRIQCNAMQCNAIPYFIYTLFIPILWCRVILFCLWNTKRYKVTYKVFLSSKFVLINLCSSFLFFFFFTNRTCQGSSQRVLCGNNEWRKAE